MVGWFISVISFCPTSLICVNVSWVKIIDLVLYRRYLAHGWGYLLGIKLLGEASSIPKIFYSVVFFPTHDLVCCTHYSKPLTSTPKFHDCNNKTHLKSCYVQVLEFIWPLKVALSSDTILSLFIYASNCWLNQNWTLHIVLYLLLR